jgi:uncharacterized membrane-anchored protein YhcB (DUF1043 family)
MMWLYVGVGFVAGVVVMLFVEAWLDAQEERRELRGGGR